MQRPETRTPNTEPEAEAPSRLPSQATVLKAALGLVRRGLRWTLKLVDLVDGFLEPEEPEDGRKPATAPDDDDFKPERIQFWFELIGKALLAAAASLAETKGKPRGPDPGAAEKAEE